MYDHQTPDRSHVLDKKFNGMAAKGRQKEKKKKKKEGEEKRWRDDMTEGFGKIMRRAKFNMGFTQPRHIYTKIESMLLRST